MQGSISGGYSVGSLCRGSFKKDTKREGSMQVSISRGYAMGLHTGEHLRRIQRGGGMQVSI